ncbi:MAG TPA: hypothetical protein GXX38_07430 [Clostridia bacterium]|jgi:stage II sporulation protein P|nr:hypothetical protein [Clostridia bacterium]
MKKKNIVKLGFTFLMFCLFIIISTSCLSSISENLTKTNNDQKDLSSEEPIVGIVYTLTSQNYHPKQPFAEEGLGEITQVGICLENKLISQNIKTINDLTIHDQPVFSQAYSKAQTTVDKLLKANPQLKLIIDLHRDAVPEDKPLDYTTIKLASGDSAAKVLFAVNQSDQNNVSLNAAQFISDYLNQSVPGLSRGIKIIDKNLASSTKKIPIITLYIGDYERNSLAEAEKTAEILAEAISSYFSIEK